MKIEHTKELDKYLENLFDINLDAFSSVDLLNVLIEESSVVDLKDYKRMESIIPYDDGYKYYYYLVNEFFEPDSLDFVISSVREITAPIKIISQDLYSDDTIKTYLNKVINCKEQNLELVKRVYGSGMLHQLEEPMIFNNKELYSYGYFEKPQSIVQLEENGNVWMSLLPNEIITMKKDVKGAKGKILCAGLGLGYYPILASLNEEVDEILVVEKNRRIIKFYEKYIRPHFKTSAKIKVICGDAIKHIIDTNSKEFDQVYVDIWHTAEDGIENYLYLKSREKDGIKYKYWIERSMLVYLRRALIILLYENYKKCEPVKRKTSEEKVLSYLNKCLIKESFNTINDVENLLSLEYIESIISNNIY